MKRQSGEYVVNGHRIINWSGWYNVNGVELRYKRFKDNIKETIEIFGPTSEDVYVTVSHSAIFHFHLIWFTFIHDSACCQ